MTVLNRKEILRQIFEERARHKQLAEAQADRLRMQIAEKAPIYANLSARITGIYMQLNREAIEKSLTREQVDALAHERVMALKQEAETALLAAGYTPDMLTPKYICPVCRDTGNPPEGQLGRCPCIERELLKRLYDVAGAEGQTFETFDLTVFSDEVTENGISPRAQMEKILAVGKRYAEDFPAKKYKNLLLLGFPGLGKSFLLNCISARVLERGFTVMRLSAYRMFEIMRRYHRGMDEGEMSSMLSVQLLVLDDLGTEPMMENITVEYFFTLVTERKNARLSTLIATNLTPAQLQSRYTERTASRLMDTADSMTLHFIGQDLRRKPMG